MSKKNTDSPIKPGGDITKTKKFTVTDDKGKETEVTMTIDIDLNGNTGKPNFTMQRVDRWAQIGQMPFGAGGGGGAINFNMNTSTPMKEGNLTKNISNLIAEDKTGIVKSTYNEGIEEVKQEIIENGGDVDLFNERLLDNDNVSSVDAIENGLNKDINDDGFIGFPESSTNNVQPSEFKSPQVKDQDLIYPIDLLTGEALSDDLGKSQDYIFIEQYAYLPPNPTEGDKLTDRGRKYGDNKKEKMNTVDKVIQFGVRRSNNVNLKERFGSCTLPIPNKLAVSNGVSWGEARANSVELAGFNAAAGTINDRLKDLDLGQLIKQGAQGTKDTFDKLKKAIQEGDDPDAGNIISATLAKSLLSQFNINVEVDQFITRQTGAAINPNLELLFGGPQLRTFSFLFNFAPNGEREAEMVRKIQRWFKQGMLPSRSGATGARPQSLFLGSPNVFRIAYKNKSRRIKGLNIIKICALTSCQIDFTPDGTYQSYEDTGAVSQPVRSTMALSFNELTPIFRDDYAAERSGFVRDPSLEDLGTNITGTNAITDSDIGF